MNKCVFLDRDGVVNLDNPEYTFTVEAFKILPGVIETVKMLKRRGFHLVIVTNQAGISKGLYTISQMKECHDYFQRECGGVIDHFYFSPYHREVTNSLLTKPGSLMFEKAIAKFNINVTQSWMVGDRGRDLVPAKKLGIKTIQIGDEVEEAERGDYRVNDLSEASKIILG